MQTKKDPKDYNKEVRENLGTGIKDLTPTSEKIFVRLFKYEDTKKTSAGLDIPLNKEHTTEAGKSVVKKDDSARSIWRPVGLIAQEPTEAAKEYIRDKLKMDLKKGDEVWIDWNSISRSIFFENRDVANAVFNGYLLIHPSQIEAKYELKSTK